MNEPTRQTDGTWIAAHGGRSCRTSTRQAAADWLAAAIYETRQGARLTELRARWSRVPGSYSALTDAPTGVGFYHRNRLVASWITAPRTRFPLYTEATNDWNPGTLDDLERALTPWLEMTP